MQRHTRQGLDLVAFGGYSGGYSDLQCSSSRGGKDGLGSELHASLAALQAFMRNDFRMLDASGLLPFTPRAVPNSLEASETPTAASRFCTT